MGRVSDFLEGLRTPSTLAVSTALAVTSASAAFLVTAIDEDFVASERGSLLFREGPEDDDLEATSRALRLAHRDPDVPLVAVFGASDVREMIDRPLFAERIAAGFDGPVEIAYLDQPKQGMLEFAALASRIPDGTRGVLLLGMGIGRFDGDPVRDATARPRVGFRTPTRIDGEALVDDGTGIFLVDNVRFYFARLPGVIRNLTRGTPSLVAHRYDTRPPMTAEAWTSKGGEIMGRLSRFDANYDRNAQILAEAIRDLRARTRMEIVVTRFPINPRFVREVIGQERHDAWLARIVELLYSNGLEAFDLSAAGLTESDYWDWLHIGDPVARARVTELVAPLVTAALRDGESRP